MSINKIPYEISLWKQGLGGEYEFLIDDEFKGVYDSFSSANDEAHFENQSGKIKMYSEEYPVILNKQEKDIDIKLVEKDKNNNSIEVSNLDKNLIDKLLYMEKSDYDEFFDSFILKDDFNINLKVINKLENFTDSTDDRLGILSFSSNIFNTEEAARSAAEQFWNIRIKAEPADDTTSKLNEKVYLDEGDYRTGGTDLSNLEQSYYPLQFYGIYESGNGTHFIYRRILLPLKTSYVINSISTTKYQNNYFCFFKIKDLINWIGNNEINWIQRKLLISKTLQIDSNTFCLQILNEGDFITINEKEADYMNLKYFPVITFSTFTKKLYISSEFSPEITNLFNINTDIMKDKKYKIVASTYNNYNIKSTFYGQGVAHKVAIIGASDSTYHFQAQNIHFIPNLDNSMQLTFDLPKFGFSPTGEYETNELITQIQQENLVRLFFSNKWYDFIVKKI